MSSKSLRKQFNRFKSELEQYRQLESQQEEALVKYKQQYKNAQEAMGILIEIAKQVQESAKESICTLVTRCLATIFDKPYEFDLRFERKRNKSEAIPILRRDGNDLEDITDEAGVGVIDVASFALIVGTTLFKSQANDTRKLVVLDEPFKFLHSPIYLERTRELISSLSEEMNIQFVFITQIDELRVGKVIHLEELISSQGH